MLVIFYSLDSLWVFMFCDCINIHPENWKIQKTIQNYCFTASICYYGPICTIIFWL